LVEAVVVGAVVVAVVVLKDVGGLVVAAVG
jgi:hypothetical protein